MKSVFPKDEVSIEEKMQLAQVKATVYELPPLEPLAPRPDQVWRTAYMEINSMREAALENYTNDRSEKNWHRLCALGDACERLLERWVKS